MYRKRKSSGGFGGICGWSFLARMAGETHGRASLRGMCGWAGALVAGVLLLGGCEREGVGEKGEMVVVNFSLSGEGFGGLKEEGTLGTGGAEGTLGTRGAQWPASETVIVPLDEELCIYATLKEEGETAFDGSQLRDLATIPTNTRVRIVAFNGGGYVDDEEYVVNNGSGDIVPVSPPGLSVASGDTYTFVAYSVSSTSSVPAYVNPLVVAPEVDLLWGNTPGGIYVGGAVSVTIGMTHKFSQVTVSVGLTSSPTQATLGTPSSVSISPGYNASLNLLTGVMGQGNAATQTVGTTWTGTSTGSAPKLTGAPRLVFTYGAKPVTVTVGSVMVGTTTYVNKVAKFDIALVEGKKYSLTMDLKRTLVWAGSNVYWNGSYLTFDAPGSGSVAQGVFFKWGSLIGISAGAEGVYGYDSSTNPYPDPDFNFADYGPNTTLYYPGGGTTTAQYMPWSDIPSRENESIPSGTNLESYLSDDERNAISAGTGWDVYKGDICRYISENGNGPEGWTYMYRMPTRAEMGEKSSYAYGDADGWTKTSGTSWSYSSTYGGLTSPDGTTGMPIYVSNSGVNFPISGLRTGGYAGTGSVYDPGALQEINYGGYYWASTADGSYARGRYLAFRETSVRFDYWGIIFTASVRCVRAN